MSTAPSFAGPAPLFPNVARLTLQGRIGAEIRAESVIRRTDALKKLPVDGVLLEISSPGGDARESDRIAEAVRSLAAEKPVVAYVPKVCASGGYMAAVGATKIVAEKWAMIGSIGVVLMRPNFARLFETLGIEVVVRKTGAFKDLGSPFRVPTQTDEDKEQELLTAFHQSFVTAVADGRGLTKTATKKLATGEVWLGEQADELNLVDEIGDAKTAQALLSQEIGGGVRVMNAALPFERQIARLTPAAISAKFAQFGLSPSGALRAEWLGEC